MRRVLKTHLECLATLPVVLSMSGKALSGNEICRAGSP